MKKLILFGAVAFAIGTFSFSGQDNESSSTSENILQSECLTVYTEGNGWIIKSKNTCDYTIQYSFTYVTEGKNAADEVVSEESSEYSDLTISGKTTNSIITAPQDPKKLITYTFKDIEVTAVSAAK
jgi:hypothetical protein